MQLSRSHCDSLAVDVFVCGLDTTHGQELSVTIIQSIKAAELLSTTHLTKHFQLYFLHQGDCFQFPY